MSPTHIVVLDMGKQMLIRGHVQTRKGKLRTQSTLVADIDGTEELKKDIRKVVRSLGIRKGEENREDIG